MSPAELAAELKELGIFTVAIDHPVVKGVRITPHLSNTLDDCLALNRALLSVYNRRFYRRGQMFDD
jgi:7-keto-8-aminopelargonate synthetase-like enzyme